MHKTLKLYLNILQNSPGGHPTFRSLNRVNPHVLFLSTITQHICRHGGSGDEMAEHLLLSCRSSGAANATEMTLKFDP